VFDYDVIVIGGGVLGCFAARSLTRYDLEVALLEKSGDLCTGISRANTAIVYSGCDTKPGTRKTSMCVRAAQGFAKLCGELGVRYSQCGSLMICFGERGAGVLERKFRDGTENGVRGVRLLTRGEVLELEPGLADNVHSGLYVPDTGTVMPWELCLAAAQSASLRGADIILNTEVTGIDAARSAADGKWKISTNNGGYSARAVINCAGMAADRVFEMFSEPVVRIVPTGGDYYILDTKAGGCIRHVIFHEPEKKGKGLTLVPTVDGNILVGPTERSPAEGSRGVDSGKPGDGGSAITKSESDIPFYTGEGYETSHEGLALLRALAAEVIPKLSLEHIIRSFGAIRPNPYMLRQNDSGGWSVDDKSVNDFCIIEAADGLCISLIGVKTPGLTCADELGSYVADKIADRLGAARGSGKRAAGVSHDFDPRRLPPVKLSEMSYTEREALVRENPDYGEIVCRCRGISEGEIADAINRFPGAATTDGVKRRTGAGSGRCQGGFCGQRVGEMLRVAGELTHDAGELPHDDGEMLRAAGEPVRDADELPRADAVSSDETDSAAGLLSGVLDYDVVVVGGGPAGMAAAAAAAGVKRGVDNGISCGAELNKATSPELRVLIIERANALGGILNQCTHYGFGLTYFGEELTGREYAGRFTGLVGALPVEVLTGVSVLDIGADGLITLTGKKTGLNRIRAKAVVLATGCRERPIGALPVAGTRPAGVYAAGAAQKMMNLGGYDLGSRFVILGSGDVGMIVARELALRGKEVVAVIEKEAFCGGLPRNRINCLEQYGIPLITQATVSQVHGTPRISGVTVTGLHGGDSVSYIECDALITSVGLIPERELLDGFAGELPEWLFLCGNVCYVHDVVDDVTVEAERAGRYAAEYALSGKWREQFGISGDKPRPEAHGAASEDEENAAVAAHSESEICIGCPKSCVVSRSSDSWSGLACGRSVPVLPELQEFPER